MTENSSSSDEFTIRKSNADTRSALDEFQSTVSDHIAAIQAAARDRLARFDSHDKNAPNTIKSKSESESIRPRTLG